MGISQRRDPRPDRALSPLFPILSLAIPALILSLAAVAIAVAATRTSDGWSVVPVGPIAQRRSAPTTAPLPNGALIAGGLGGTMTAEVFNEKRRSFTALDASIVEPRFLGVAAPLPAGRVLIAGGGTNRGAEVFNPKTGRFSAASGEMGQVRIAAAASPLPRGRVLIVGGYDEHACVPAQVEQSAEVFDPKTGRFSRVPAMMQEPRWGAAAAPLPDGKVLIAGGSNHHTPRRAESSAEVFNPETGSFSRVPNTMSMGRVNSAAAVLRDGRVLIVSGHEGNGRSFSKRVALSAEVFDPRTDRFSRIGVTLNKPSGAAAMAPYIYGRLAVGLPNGNVLITGGNGQSAELLRPPRQADPRRTPRYSSRSSSRAQPLMQ